MKQLSFWASRIFSFILIYLNIFGESTASTFSENQLPFGKIFCFFESFIFSFLSFIFRIFLMSPRYQWSLFTIIAAVFFVTFTDFKHIFDQSESRKKWTNQRKEKFIIRAHSFYLQRREIALASWNIAKIWILHCLGNSLFVLDFELPKNNFDQSELEIFDQSEFRILGQSESKITFSLDFNLHPESTKACKRPFPFLHSKFVDFITWVIWIFFEILSLV